MYMVWFMGRGKETPAIDATPKAFLASTVMKLDVFFTDDSCAYLAALEAVLPNDEVHRADGDIQEWWIDFCFVFFMLGQLIRVDLF